MTRSRQSDRRWSRPLRIASWTAAIIILLLGAGTSTVLTQTMGCQAYNLYPTNATATSQGGNGSFTFSFTGSGLYGYGCAIQAYPSQPWVTAKVTQGASTGTVNYSVAANTASTSRSGVIAVGTSASSTATFSISQMAGTPVVTALAGDSLVVGSMTIATYGRIQNLPLPAFTNQKYCGLVQLATGLFVQAYVPTAAERTGNFSAFAGLLLDPLANNAPFPGGIIPASRIPNPLPWRISGYADTGPSFCAAFPAGFTPYSAVNYTSAQLGGGPIVITNTDPTSIAANSGSFTLTLYGRGFSQSSDTRVNFNGDLLNPSINLGVRLTVSVPNSDIASPGTANIFVTTPSLGLVSNVVRIPIVSAPGPFLSVSTSTSPLPELSVTPNFGTGPVSETDQIFVSGAPGQTVQVQVTQITPTPQKWITVSPSSFTIPASGSQAVDVKFVSQGLAPQTYAAVIKVTAFKGTAPMAEKRIDEAITESAVPNDTPGTTIIDTKTIAVTANFVGQTLSPSAPFLSFSYVAANGLPPGAKTLALTPVNVTSGGIPAITVTSSIQSPPSTNWLSVDSGNLPSSISVMAKPGTLSPGPCPGPGTSYLAQLSFTLNALPSVIVPVALNVKCAPDAQVAFPTYQLGDPLPGAQTFPFPQLNANPNPNGFAFDLNSETNWLQVNPQHGETSNTLNLLFSADSVAANLASGRHVGYATAVDQNNPTNVYIIGVSLSVPAPAPPPLVILNASLPDGAVNQPYPSTTLTASGGTSPIAWSIPAASIPPGLGLQGAVLAGTPTAANSYTIPVTVTDSSIPPLTATKNFTINITPPVVTTTKPIIASVKNAASEESFISPNAFVEIKGTNLANEMRDWTGAPDFASGRLPTTVAGISVTIDGRPAYVAYISPVQVNVLAPIDPAVQNVQVVVTNNGVSSEAFTVPLHAIAPAFFANFVSGNIAATHTDNSPVAPVGTYPNSRPAAPNEIIAIWATGFGATNPSIPDGQLVTAPRQLMNALTVTIGGLNADVQFAGLVGAGLYQINVRVPPSAPDGDLPVKGSIQGVQTIDGIIVPVHR